MVELQGGVWDGTCRLIRRAEGAGAVVSARCQPPSLTHVAFALYGPAAPLYSCAQRGPPAHVAVVITHSLPLPVMLLLLLTPLLLCPPFPPRHRRPQVLGWLQMSTIVVMAVGARMPQIWLNWRRGNAGVLSVATCCLNVAGCVVRIFTTVVLTVSRRGGGKQEEEREEGRRRGA